MVINIFSKFTFNGLINNICSGCGAVVAPLFYFESIFFIIKTKRIKRNRETYGFLEFYVILFLMVF